MTKDFAEIDQRALAKLAQEMDSEGIEYLATHGPKAVGTPITPADLQEMFPLGTAAGSDVPSRVNR